RPVMQAAFLLVVVLPPPAAGALALARLHCAGAGRAADREKALIVQRIVWNSLLPHERDDALACPVKERIDFDERTGGIDRRIGCCGAFPRLLGSHARDPAGGAIERAAERLDLAHPAAGLPR